MFTQHVRKYILFNEKVYKISYIKVNLHKRYNNLIIFFMCFLGQTYVYVVKMQ